MTLLCPITVCGASAVSLLQRLPQAALQCTQWCFRNIWLAVGSLMPV